MSRIYEALKRAESEGTVSWREQQSAKLAGYAQDSFPKASVVELESDLLPNRPAAMGTRSPSLSAAPTVDAFDIAKRRWNPSLSQLPALLHYGAAVEQFRSLRSRLFELRNQNPLKSILISSGLPQEGKSFIAANLAISLARHKDSKVLLIDGDMRHCTLHLLLGCDSQPGLPDYLSGEASVPEVMQKADPIHNVGKLSPQILQNLAFIAGGNNSEEAADLSGNLRFAELIAAVAPSFDWIVVDSSPVIPVSDAKNLARACDGTLLVAREGITQFQVARQAQSELRDSNILGFVLNGAEVPPMAAYYYETGSPEA